MKTIKRVALGEVAELIDYGLSVSSSNINNGYRLLRITDIQNESVAWENVPYCSEVPFDIYKYYLEDGDIVFSRTGATTGKSYLITNCPPKTVFASYLIRIKLDKHAIYSKYLSFYFKTKSYWNKILSDSSGSTLPGFNSSKLNILTIPLPPLEIQKQIAVRLEKADEIRRMRRYAIELSERFLQEVFIDMFGDPVKNPKGWNVVMIKDIAEKITAGPFGSNLKKESYVNEGYKVYGQEQVIPDNYEIGDYFIDEKKFMELKQYEVFPDDILISLVGSFGKISIVPSNIKKGIINPRLLKITLNKKFIIPTFFKALFDNNYMREKVTEMSHGGTMGILNAAIIKEADIILPTIKSQVKFNELYYKHKTLIAQQREALRQSELLFSSLLNEAFEE